MDSPGNQILSRSAFALDENRNIRLRNVFDSCLDSAQLRAVRKENLENSPHGNLTNEQSMCQGNIRSKNINNPLTLQRLAGLFLTHQLSSFLSNREKGEKIGEKVPKYFHCCSNGDQSYLIEEQT